MELSSDLLSMLTTVDEKYRSALTSTLKNIPATDRSEYMQIYNQKGAYLVYKSGQTYYHGKNESQNYFYFPTTLKEYHKPQKYTRLEQIPQIHTQHEFPWGGWRDHYEYIFPVYKLPDPECDNKSDAKIEALLSCLDLRDKIPVANFRDLLKR